MREQLSESIVVLDMTALAEAIIGRACRILGEETSIERLTRAIKSKPRLPSLPAKRASGLADPPHQNARGSRGEHISLAAVMDFGDDTKKSFYGHFLEAQAGGSSAPPISSPALSLIVP